MRRRPPRSTRTDTLCPYTTLFRSCGHGLISTVSATVIADDSIMMLVVPTASEDRRTEDCSQLLGRKRMALVTLPHGIAELETTNRISFDVALIERPIKHTAKTEIGRAHVCTPVTNAHLVCRLLLEQ